MSQGPELSFRYDAKVPGRMAAYCYGTAIFMSVVTIALAIFGRSGAWLAWVGLALFAATAAFYFWRAVAVKRELTVEDGHAMSILSEGIRLGGSRVLRWDELDLLLIDGRESSASKPTPAPLRAALMGVSHIRATVFEPTDKDPIRVRTYRGAYSNALPGGRSEFLAICQQLAAVVKGHEQVRFRVASGMQWSLGDQVGGVKEYSTVEELSIGTERGLKEGERQRRARQRTDAASPDSPHGEEPLS